jgi:2-oxoglutarate dehydrogenase E1 component
MFSEVGQVEPTGTEPRGVWEKYFGGAEPVEQPETGVPKEQLASLLRGLTDIPSGFQVHPKLERAMAARREMAEGKRPLDWSAAEALALAALAVEGVRLRLAGQDSARGTFSQRHMVLHDQESGLQHIPLQHLVAGQGPVDIVNSPLNETGSLGFEYGYSLDCPSGLVIWEAQFGDFVNAAQVIIDQFIASGEDKWRRLSGLILLLPHGFEGMGAEHSSARLERFLALAAEDNVQIVQPTTPAQYFHCLRRQALRPWRKPLIVFTPKSLLRHPKVVSPLEEFTSGSFQRVLPDSGAVGPCKRVLMCTGKVYFDLQAYREENHHADVALLRLEQLYPWRDAPMSAALSGAADGTPVVWVQEEPENMGAWRYLRGRFGETLFGRFPLRLISRPESASPASGSHAAHLMEQQELIRQAFDQPDRRVVPPKKG